ncbi:MAG: hypothetical protein JWL77_4936, partial [Chthonomonadaceae bacterium]|nr:hypothetical protein [Chthonomonadaceae bacterium]
AKAQLSNGGWGQGEESAEIGRGLDLKDKPSVADTCMATMAMLRSGSTPMTGEYSKNIRHGVEFVCGEVEESDKSSLYVTNNRSTRIQIKLGPYIDTFMASMVLAEVSGEMPDAKSEARVSRAYQKVMDKIDKNQKSDGTWDNKGWAPVLSHAMAARAINRAAQKGLAVNEKTRLRTENYARGQFADASKPSSSAGVPGSGGAYASASISGKSVSGFAGRSASGAAKGDAGVSLYSTSADLATLQNSDDTNKALEQHAQIQLKAAKTPKDKEAAQATLNRVAGNRKDLAAAQKDVVTKVSSQSFMSGFGSNGGEEYLSYMNIGESLVAKGGEDWKKWDTSITAKVNGVQNQDGTWSGYHCITGRTVCTAAALMVLMVDRARVPVALKLKTTASGRK